MRVMFWHLIASLCKESQSVTLAQPSEEYSRKLAPIKTSPEIRRIQGLARLSLPESPGGFAQVRALVARQRD